MEKVVIAHGLWMPGLETWQLRQRLRAGGFAPVLYRYPTVTASLTENVDRLISFVAEEPGETLHIVGYSLGGVIGVAAANRGGLTRPGRIVCLGAPLNGTAAGRALARLPGGQRLGGRSIAELNARHGLDRIGPGLDVGCIAGSGGFGMGRLVAGLDGPNDGTVTVAETRLEGLTDHLVLPVTHTTMLFDGVVARQTIAFLRHGAFTRQTQQR
jgi:pimeloyl-ACP methyl ester carboxylesterase